ncbi:chloride channel protein [Pandoraea pulmonicola]|uniref:Chloride channel protein n=1 Tax=Pandoraea pulmonicola TaxID=93221 RepID=A0AAJ4ZGB0_PANPU|nr:chloride channel protein [Pandoraea pulmonicola]APD13559.1 chloride channel protein [Pandoraea pulmonicola]SUA92846.1 H(+)/Cl(-) exchange transporter ClcA [Pandoraea pulmonicola]
MHRSLRLWHNYGVFWLGAVLVGLVSVAYAKLMDFGFELFQRMLSHGFWVPLVVTPVGAALAIWLTQKFFKGSEGSGIPQVIATLQDSHLSKSLLTLRIMFGKIAVSFLGIVCGFTIGREGPTVQIGASLMYAMRRGYRRSSAHIERQLTLAGAAAGLAAAFNTPLAGVVFAIEELSRSFVARNSGTLITAIIFSGVVALGLQGNYLYFGHIKALSEFRWTLIPVLIAASLITGVSGGLFSWLMLNIARWMPAPLVKLRRARPVHFAFLCGLAIAAIGIASGGLTFGSGYTEARALLETHETLSPFYALMKFAALSVSYLSGIPGGIFAPSLAIGAGLGSLLASITSVVPLPAMAALCMVGYLAAVTQSPITSFVIVMEMIDGHQMVIPLMAVALLSTQVSKTIAPSFYHALAHRFLTPTAPAPLQG